MSEQQSQHPHQQGTECPPKIPLADDDEPEMVVIYSKKQESAIQINNNVKSSGHSKRDDIQGLRTVAIVSVMLFHLWPKVFVNGFLGVDVFFVISGFLMAQILSVSGKMLPLTMERVGHFFRRRIQRIVPIYIFLVYITLHVGSVLLSSQDFMQMCKDGVYAILFGSNMQTIMHHEVFTYRFFMHTWSLGVEMQFYTMVPFMFHLIFLHPYFQRYLPTVSFIIISLSILLQFGSREAVAFGLVFCRMWQFQAGMLAYFGVAKAQNTAKTTLQNTVKEESVALLSELEEDKDQMTEIKFNAENLELPNEDSPSKAFTVPEIFNTILPFSLFMLLCGVLFMPIQLASGTPGMLGPLILQCVVIFVTASLIYLGGNLTILENDGKIVVPAILSSRIAVEIGDASYIWYLIHWPFIQFVNYFSVETTMPIMDGTLVFLGSLTLALVIDRLVDANFRKIKSLKALILVLATLYTLCFIMLAPTDFFYKFPTNSANSSNFLLPELDLGADSADLILGGNDSNVTADVLDFNNTTV